jgi:hypothetical protein
MGLGVIRDPGRRCINHDNRGTRAQKLAAARPTAKLCCWHGGNPSIVQVTRSAASPAWSRLNHGPMRVMHDQGRLRGVCCMQCWSYR